MNNVQTISLETWAEELPIATILILLTIYICNPQISSNWLSWILGAQRCSTHFISTPSVFFNTRVNLEPLWPGERKENKPRVFRDWTGTRARPWMDMSREIKGHHPDQGVWYLYDDLVIKRWQNEGTALKKIQW